MRERSAASRTRAPPRSGRWANSSLPSCASSWGGEREAPARDAVEHEPHRGEEEDAQDHVAGFAQDSGERAGQVDFAQSGEDGVVDVEERDQDSRQSAAGDEAGGEETAG